MLHALYLANFRNYSSLRQVFSPGVTVLEGANGQGKSNLLEAIYFLSILRSFRTNQVRHLCCWQKQAFQVGAVLSDDQGIEIGRLSVCFGERRRLLINGVESRRSSDFIGRLNAIMFAPEDLSLIKGVAAGRRRFIDILLSQLYPDYLAALQDYSRALRSRNALLKQSPPPRAATAAFDAVLINRGTRIYRERLRFATFFSPLLQQAAEQLADTTGSSFTIRYRPSAIEEQTDDNAIEAVYAAQLAESWEKDLLRGHTRIGPHRDDFQILLNEKSLAYFGSEGQCRLAALILKATAAELLQSKNKQLVILVDDVVGELDNVRRDAFCRLLNRTPQAFVACTSRAVLGSLTPSAVFQVKNGTLTPA